MHRHLLVFIMCEPETGNGGIVILLLVFSLPCQFLFDPLIPAPTKCKLNNIKQREIVKGIKRTQKAVLIDF